MKKSNLKKMLAIVLCLMICASAMTLFASADTATAPTFEKTVYVSSTGNDDNDGLTPQTAVKSLEVASLRLEKAGGKIVVLDDITVDYSTATANQYVYFAENNVTVYLHGVAQNDGGYSKIKFTCPKPVIFELSSPLAVYDIELERDLGTAWVFSCNSYPITIGENVNTLNAGTQAQASAKTHSKFMIFGGRFNAASSAPASLTPKNIVSVMSGTWAQVYGDGNAAGTMVNTEVNILGGHIYELYSMHPEKGTTGDGVCNIYGGTVTAYKGHALRDNQHDIANFYNGAESGVETMTNSLATDSNAVIPATINKLTGTVPTFFELAHHDLTPEAPPAFDDEPGDEFVEEQIPSNTDTPETNAPETNSPTPNAPETSAVGEEKSGCGSAIGAGALVVAAVLGTAVAVGKKKEQ